MPFLDKRKIMSLSIFSMTIYQACDNLLAGNLNCLRKLDYNGDTRPKLVKDADRLSNQDEHIVSLVS